MAGAVEVHHLPVPLGDAGLEAELGLADRRQPPGKPGLLFTAPYLDVRKLGHVRVQGVQRLVVDALVVIQPQRVCVLDTPTHTTTHFTPQLDNRRLRLRLQDDGSAGRRTGNR